MHSIRLPAWPKLREFAIRTETELSGPSEPSTAQPGFLLGGPAALGCGEGVCTLTHQKSHEERRQRCSQTHPKVQTAPGLRHGFFATELGAKSAVRSLGGADELRECTRGPAEHPGSRRAQPPLATPPPPGFLRGRVKLCEKHLLAPFFLGGLRGENPAA